MTRSASHSGSLGRIAEPRLHPQSYRRLEQIGVACHVPLRRTTRSRRCCRWLHGSNDIACSLDLASEVRRIDADARAQHLFVDGTQLLQRERLARRDEEAHGNGGGFHHRLHRLSRSENGVGPIDRAEEFIAVIDHHERR